MLNSMLTFELRYINESTESTSCEFPKFFFENFQLLSLSNDNDNDWRKRKLDSSAFRPSCLSPDRHAKPSTKAIIQDVKFGEMVDFNLGFETIRREK